MLKKPVSPKQTAKETHDKVKEKANETEQIEVKKKSLTPLEKPVEESKQEVSKQKSPIKEKPKQIVPTNPEKIKEKLAKCGKLADLKAQLAEFAAAKEKVTKSKSKPKTKAAETPKSEPPKP